jgi:asparagine synthase (glutamine-hydrolysing)
MRGGLGRKIDELLSPESIERRGLFDATAVRNLIDQDRLGRIDAAYPIFELICIETWCKLFVDRQPVT